MSATNDIVFETVGRAGVVTLNKPETLNAVTDTMLRALDYHLDIWEVDPAIERIVVKAAPGRAFSAGGDIRHLYECGLAKDYDFDFFAREYRLNARIASFPKPYIALVDGIVMGGGVGVSFHGHVVAGEKISFAMPEVGIGFFPDVGASYLLNKAPQEMALYIGLTGNRLNQSECMALGLVGSTCKSQEMDDLYDAICHQDDLDSVLSQYQAPQGEASVINFADEIKDVFLEPDIASILSRLELMSGNQELSEEKRSWAGKILKSLNQKSPTSLFVAHRQINSGRGLSVEQCMNMEFRILNRILVGADFYEGIRAAIIDKDRSPAWNPSSIATVDPGEIDEHFESLGNDELLLT